MNNNPYAAAQAPLTMPTSLSAKLSSLLTGQNWWRLATIVLAITAGFLGWLVYEKYAECERMAATGTLDKKIIKIQMDMITGHNVRESRIELGMENR